MGDIEPRRAPHRDRSNVKNFAARNGGAEVAYETKVIGFSIMVPCPELRRSLACDPRRTVVRQNRRA